MAFTRIEQSDVANKGVIGLPDTPAMTTTEIQQKFDQLALEVLMPKHNGLIDELEAGTAGASIKVKDANDEDITLQERLDDIAAGGYTKEEADATFETITGASETYLSQEDAASTYLSLEDASDDYLTKDDASDTYLSQTSASSTYLSQSDASDTYLSKADASSTYLSKSDASDDYLSKSQASSDYLSKSDASSTYLTQSNASSTYLSKADATSDYLSKTDASSTYLSKSDASSDYLNKTDAASTYLSKSDASSTYVAQESGKGLSTNDYDNTEKAKLAGIEANANNYVLPVGNLTVLGGVKADGVTFNIDENGVGHAAGGGGSLDYNDLSNRPQINGFTLTGDKSPSELEIALPQLFDTEITSPSDGQIIQYDGTDQVWKNVNYQAQAQADWSESDSSAPDYIKNKPNLATVATSGAYSDLSGTPSLATVATSGSYNDLSNTPTIPAAQVNADWNASSGVAQILNKPTIPDVSTKMNTDGSNAASEVTFSGAATIGRRWSSSAVGTASIANGTDIIATSANSFASGSKYGGNLTQATGDSSCAIGQGTGAFEASASAMGRYVSASGTGAHAEGCANNAGYIKASGMGSHAEGYAASGKKILASGAGAHAEGYADGYDIEAAYYGAHAEGVATDRKLYASARGAHAEGNGSQATNSSAHAEGSITTASGYYSHSEGSETTASGDGSHAGGCNITTPMYAQFAHGNYRSAYKKFRGTTMTGYGACFGFGMNNDEHTADTSVTTGKNGLNGTIINTATATISLETQAMYLLCVSSYTISTGAVYGSAVYLVTAHGLSTGTPNNLSVKVSSNAPATVATAANNKITIKNGATSRATQFQLMRIN